MTFDDLTSTPGGDPTLLYRYRDALHAADLLIVGLHLDLFSALAAQPGTLPELCDRFGITPRPTDVMLTLFAAMDLVRNDHGIYRVTDAAREHLVKGSPWYLGPYYPTLADRRVAGELLDVLRTGKPANWGT